MARTKKIESVWGSISPYRMADGRIRYRLRGVIDGQLKSCGVFDTIEDARAQARSLRDATAPIGHGLTLGAWGRRWLDKLDLEGVRTATDKRRVWDRYIAPSELAPMPIRKVRPEHVRKWLDALARRKTTRGAPLGDQTMKNAFYALSAGLRDAQYAGHISANPCRGVRVRRRGRTTSPWTYLELHEIDMILSSPQLPQRQRIIFGVAIYTGLRAGELWGLRWSDVTLRGDDPRIDVRKSYDGPTKGGKPRRVPLLPPALALLTEWRAAQTVEKLGALVFESGRTDKTPKEGTRPDMHAPGYDGEWAARYRKRVGIRRRVTLRDMRHTYASHLIMGSWGRAWRLEEIQQLLGHASRTTTERYAHLAPDSIRGAGHEATRMWSHPGSGKVLTGPPDTPK